MAVEHDKLKIETSIKLDCPGIEIKEIKQSNTIEVQEPTRRRVEISGNQLQNLCALPVAVGDVPSIDAKKEFVLITVRLAKQDANKGVQGVFVGNNAKFNPGIIEEYQKIEGDNTAAFWKGASGKFSIPVQSVPPAASVPAGTLYVVNPNKTPVILEINYGISFTPPSPPNPPTSPNPNPLGPEGHPPHPASTRTS